MPRAGSKTASTAPVPRNPLDPGKLMLTKWTATLPQQQEKHFLVTGLLMPDPPGTPVVHVQIEAVHSRRTRVIEWRELRDVAVWRQGWR